MKHFFSNFSLTENQTQLVAKLDNFFKSDDNCFILKGYAGVGKTYMVKLLKEYFNSKKINFLLSAPTSKATLKLKEFDKSAMTIHKRIFKLSKVEDYKFYFQLKQNLDTNSIYLFDESSMIGDYCKETKDNSDGFLFFGSGKLLSDILQYVGDKKIIFVGDNAQLPPVDMNFSPALNKEYLENEFNLKVQEFELSEVVRQKSDSQILKTATNIRNSIKNKIFNELNIEYKNNIFETNKTIFLENYKKHQIIIAYTNKKVYEYNCMVRNQLFKNSNVLNPNDILMVVQNNYKFDMFNNELVMIQSVADSESFLIPIGKEGNKIENFVIKKDDKFFVKLDFQNIKIIKRDNEGNLEEKSIKILTNLLFNLSSHENMDNYITSLRLINKALWIFFNIRMNKKKIKKDSQEFIENLLTDNYLNALIVKFGYAITGHKAQGSEWNDVYVDANFEGGKNNENYFRWLYTVITRAKQNLFMIEMPKMNMIKDIKSVTTGLNIGYEIKNNFLSDIQEIILKQYKVEFKFFPYKIRCNFEDKTIIDIIYNSKNQITHIKALKQGDNYQNISNFLADLKGGIFIENEISFDNPHLENLYKKTAEKLSKIGVKIINIKHLNWRERYEVLKESKKVEIDFTYTKKYIFTAHLTGDENLINEIKEIL